MSIKLEGCVALVQVFDMPRSLAFYRDVLGFEVVQSSGPGDDAGWVWLRHGDAEVMLNTMYEADDRPGAPDPVRVAAHADTTLFVGCRDLDGAYAYFRSKGLDVAPPVIRDYGMKQLSLSDPDGYGVCLQWSAR